MQSEGALAFRDLWDAPIPEAITTIEALGYVLGERAKAFDHEIARATRGRRR